MKLGGNIYKFAFLLRGFMIVPARSRPTGLGFLALGSNVFNCILKYNLQTFVHVFLLHHVFLPGEVVARFQTLSALSLSRGFVATLVNWSRLPSVVRVRGSELRLSDPVRARLRAPRGGARFTTRACESRVCHVDVCEV